MNHFVNRKRFKLYHRFHLVESSILPFLVAVLLGVILFNFVFVHLNQKVPSDIVLYQRMLYFAIVAFSVVVTGWFWVIREEATVFGKHNLKVSKGLKLGFYLFIVSEAFFFVAMFWTFLYNLWNPSVDGLGQAWISPMMPITLNWRGVPAVESVLLFGSAVTAHLAKAALRERQNLEETGDFLLLTMFLGVVFVFAQLGEYSTYRYSMNTNVYGSIFFFGTGFHGFHVMMGLIYLLVTYISLYSYDFTPRKFFGFKLAIIYWHFVDIVWIFLMGIFYIAPASPRDSWYTPLYTGDFARLYHIYWEKPWSHPPAVWAISASFKRLYQ